MASIPFTVRVDPSLKSALEAEAARADLPASQVVVQAIRTHLATQQAERVAIEAALAEADAGRFVSGDAMMAWIASWDTDDELPAPKA